MPQSFYSAQKKSKAVNVSKKQMRECGFVESARVKKRKLFEKQQRRESARAVNAMMRMIHFTH